MEVHPKQIGMMGGSIEELWELLKGMGGVVTLDCASIVKDRFLTLESCTSVQIRF